MSLITINDARAALGLNLLSEADGGHMKLDQRWVSRQLVPRLPIKPSDEEVAEQMFNAYNEESPNPWKTFDGRDVPRWPDLGEQVQAKWIAAAKKAKALYGQT